MAFTLAELIGQSKPHKAPPAPVTEEICAVTAKICYASKRAARATAYRMNLQYQRRPLRPYLCDFANHWHLGHRRGS